MISNIPWFLVAQKRKIRRQKQKYSTSTATLILGKCKITDERTPEEKILQPSVTLIVTTYLKSSGKTHHFPDYETVSKSETEIIFR